MSKVLWHVTMSLDGFISGPDDDMSWLSDDVGPNPTVDEVVPQIRAVLMGRRTFGPTTGDPDDGQVYGERWKGSQFVLTHRRPEPPIPGYTFVTDLHSGVTAAKAAAGDGYVAVLGAQTARQCLEAGLLDEILVHLTPVLLGDGVRLFSRQGAERVRLERIDVTHADQVTNLWFRVKAQPGPTSP
ncbi:dihydrofolate reductase family protein [Micromonosporaceae bacterium Da 78-11]